MHDLLSLHLPIAQSFLPLLLAAAPLISRLFGGGADAAAKARQAEADLNVKRDTLAEQAFQAQQNAQMNAGNLDLQRKGFEEQARSTRAKQAAIADMLANFKGTQINIPGIKSAQITGGLNVNSPGVQQAMSGLRQQALLAQLKGDTPGGEGFTGGALLTPPAQAAIPKASGWEKFLGIAGQIAGLGGALGGLGGMQQGGLGGTMPGGPIVLNNRGGQYGDQP